MKEGKKAGCDNSSMSPIESREQPRLPRPARARAPDSTAARSRVSSRGLGDIQDLNLFPTTSLDFHSRSKSSIYMLLPYEKLSGIDLGRIRNSKSIAGIPTILNLEYFLLPSHVRVYRWNLHLTSSSPMNGPSFATSPPAILRSFFSLSLFSTYQVREATPTFAAR